MLLLLASFTLSVSSHILQIDYINFFRDISKEVAADVTSAEKLLKRRLPIGSHTSERVSGYIILFNLHVNNNCSTCRLLLKILLSKG